MSEQITPGPEFHKDGTITYYADDGDGIWFYERQQFDHLHVDIEQKYKECYEILQRVVKGLKRYGTSIGELFGEDEEFMPAFQDAKVFLAIEQPSKDDGK